MSCCSRQCLVVPAAELSDWGRFGIGLGSVWDRLGVGLGAVWDRFGVGLGSIWGWFGVTLASLWHDFWTFSNFVQNRPRPIPQHFPIKTKPFPCAHLTKYRYVQKCLLKRLKKTGTMSFQGFHERSSKQTRSKHGTDRQHVLNQHRTSRP